MGTTRSEPVLERSLEAVSKSVLEIGSEFTKENGRNFIRMRQPNSSFTGVMLGRVALVVLMTVIGFGLAGVWRPTSVASQANRLVGQFGSSSADVSGSITEIDKSRATKLSSEGRKPVLNASASPFSIFSSDSSALSALLPDPPARAIVRHGFNLNGRIEGSVQQLMGESNILNSSAVLTGDLMVPGSPNLIRNGTTTFGGTVVGTGSAQPNNYSVTMNSGSRLGRLLTRTDAVAMPTVAAPPAPTGTRNVTINSSSQSPGDFATLRNLTLNSNVGNFTIPPGTYGSFTANSGSGFILGIAGATQPSVYNFSTLTLNSSSQFQVVGPVVITVGTNLTLNASTGSSANPGWLQIKIASGGVTLNTGSTLHGSVIAPSGTVTINARLVGNVTADRLTVNSGGVLQVTQADTTPPVVTLQQPADGFATNGSQVVVSGTYSDESSVSITVNGSPVVTQGASFSTAVPLNEGNNTISIVATDALGNQSTVLRNVVRDTANPALTISQPAENAYSNTPTLSVAGTVDDQTSVNVSVNGVVATLTGNTYSAVIPLSEGTNTIVATATDAAGNSTAVSRHVTRDTVPPALTILQPAEGINTPDSTILVTGTFSDANPVEININGVTASISGSTYSANAPLITGAGLVIVTAVDAAGNETSRERKIKSAPSLSLNLERPVEGAVTNSKSVRVEGTVSGIDVGVSVNGASFEVVGGYVFGGDVDLNEGPNTVRVIATDVVGRTHEVTRSVVVDTTEPVFSEISPAEGEMIEGATTNIRGKVNDATTASVTVNNTSVTVDSNGFFSLQNFSVAEGENNVQIKAIDGVGNSKMVDLTFRGKDRTAPPVPSLFPIPAVTKMSSQTLEGRAEPGATVLINGGVEPVIADAAFGSGLFFANVMLAEGANNLTVMARDRGGNDSAVLATSITYDPSITTPPGQAARLNISTNDAQKGLTGQELPRPLIVRVTDRLGEPVGGVGVKFNVAYGDGQFVGGGSGELIAMTDAQGLARARYVAGAKTGVHLIRADFEGNLFKPLTLTAEILKPRPNGETAVKGLVLDQNLRALPNVLVRLGGQQTRTGPNGRFRMTNVQSGPHQILELIGRDQIPFPGRWPNISYDLDVLPGIENSLGKPLFLPRVNAGISLPLNSDNVVTADTVYELPVVGGRPPVRALVRAGTRIIFPPDVTDRRFSITRIEPDRVPMTLEDGRSTNLYISVQPSGAVFETPVDISYPNLDGLAPNERTLLMSFDHDAGRYVQVGTGTVSADGRIVKSDAGSGIRVGAWHALPPAVPPDAAPPEATVLSFVQIEGNPAFEGKDVEVTEASVLGARVIPYNEETNAGGILSKILLRGVVSFPRNSPPQTSKVLAYTNAQQPRIQFDDGAFDPLIRELFLAEDKEISLSWKVDGVANSDYKITCGKPDEKKVRVTCNNTTITVKGVIGKYDDAGRTSFTVKADGSKNGKVKEIKINVNLVKVRYKENKAASGFDNLVRGDMQDKSKLKFSAAPLTPVGVFIGDTFYKDPNDATNETKEAWLTVVKDYKADPLLPLSAQIAKFEIKPESAKDFIKFESQDTTKATVDSVDKQAKTVMVKAVATTGATGPANETKIVAKLDQNAYKAETFEFGKFQVVVRKNVKVNVAFYFLKDTAAGVQARLDPDDIDDYIKKINDILTPQTGIEYTKHKVIHWETTKSFNYTPTAASNLGLLKKNFGLHTTPADWTEIATGKDASNNPSTQPKLCDTGADREVYIVHNVEQVEAVGNTETNTILGAFWDLHGTIITDQKAPFVLAHEIGHSIYLRPADSQYRYYECYNRATTPAGQQAMCQTDPTQTNASFFDPAHSAVKREMMFKYDDNSKGYYIPKEDVDQGINQISGYDWFRGGFTKRPC